MKIACNYSGFKSEKLEELKNCFLIKSIGLEIF